MEIRSSKLVDLVVAIAAKTAHSVNRAYCEALGDMSQQEWGAAPDWQRRSAVAGVREVLRNPSRTPEQVHTGWLADKKAEGWVYGKEKDIHRKTHPCLLPYLALPAEQRAKDQLFVYVVKAVLDFYGLLK